MSKVKVEITYTSRGLAGTAGGDQFLGDDKAEPDSISCGLSEYKYNYFCLCGKGARVDEKRM